MALQGCAIACARASAKRFFVGSGGSDDGELSTLKSMLFVHPSWRSGQVSLATFAATNHLMLYYVDF
jgi:hypothetical protein